MTGRKICILHIAVDINTPYRAPTTRAVERLIQELPDFDNIVIAPRRSVRPRPGPTCECSTPSGRLFDMPYFGLPFGIGLKRAMRKAACEMIALLEKQGIKPDLVHAHKLSIEGLSGYDVARHFNAPLFASLRGEVETKVFRYKPRLRAQFRKIAAYASRLYFVSAWFEREFERQVPGQALKARRLPNIVRNISPSIDIRQPGDRMVAVLDLDTRKRKGLAELLEGLSLATRHEPQLKLDIIGGGTSGSIGAVRGMIRERNLIEQVRLIGPLSNAALLERLSDYRALVLPSVNETFGMVYVEAIFAGIPVLYTAGTGIDGYLDGLEVGIAVPPRDPAAVGAALLDLWRDPGTRRGNIALAAPALFATFDPKAVISNYRRDVHHAVRIADPSENQV